ncbi:hypothetical protein KCH_31460 [Kitasatospora cheerisanensis KCTC 2395]|uniref:RNA polymerase sigma-70 region 2 domain-containing protein n=1 Tax=Kitasatospora cheerisanensis KCTC 2395 TaxID=1348663 RepID=A0A066YUY3_9ACTN|nr:hypothetical protein KCH_31460 [Kitasatospora cheerisanensis KCTC 2395]
MTEEEFTEFYRHSVHRLTGQLYVVTGDLHEAQDVVQEAFVRAWGHRRTLDRDQAPRPGSAPSPDAWRSAAGGGPAPPPGPGGGTANPPTSPDRTRPPSTWPPHCAACRSASGCAPPCSTSATCRSRRSPPRPAWPPAPSRPTCPGPEPRSSSSSTPPPRPRRTSDDFLQ